MMNFLYKLYYLLPHDDSLGYITKRLNRLYSKVLSSLMGVYTVRRYQKEQTSYPKLESDLTKKEGRYIVSLTSFPDRIPDVWISIESIMRQTVKPDQIILWLAESQFPDKQLPQTLLTLEKRGLTIRFCEDLKSHKKYYFTMKEFPEDHIILIDDDMYYPVNLIENLIEIHKQHPHSVAATRAHKITYDKAGNALPYKKWKRNYVKKKENEHPFLFFTSGFGTLIPAHSLSKEVFDKEVFMRICPAADDVWLNICAEIQGTPVVNNAVFDKDAISIAKTQRKTLAHDNVKRGGNDKQIKDVCTYFNLPGIGRSNIIS